MGLRMGGPRVGKLSGEDYQYLAEKLGPRFNESLTIKSLFVIGNGV